MSREKPIVVMFYYHWDGPVWREQTVASIRAVTDLCEQHGVRMHYGFVGVVLQQLLEDAPEVVEQIIRLRMPVAYHGGAGHFRPGPVAHPPDLREMSWDDAVRAMWSFETHTLDLESMQPTPGRMGGYLAVQSILGVIPLPTDIEGWGDMEIPSEFVLSRMGAGSYPVASPFDADAVSIYPLAEPQLYTHSGTGGVPATYYGKPSGVDAPMMADPVRWFEIMAHNLPDDRTYVLQAMSHGALDIAELDRMTGFLVDHPDDFCVTHPDPDGVQWLPENSALAFYQRTYGIRSLDELMELSEPPTPLPVRVTAAEIAGAADAVLSTSALNTHDGDFAEPPEFIELGDHRLSLAQGFQALAHSLAHWAERGELPGALQLPFIHGPVDTPRYHREVNPSPPEIHTIGYTPMDLPVAEVPDADVINSQGLPPSGDYHIWAPTHTIVEGEVIIAVASVLDLSNHVPGVIRVAIQSEDSRGVEPRMLEVALNPAEFMYAMAQVYRLLARDGKPGPVGVASMKVSSTQRTECVLVKPGGYRDSFIWRSDLTPAELDAAWTRAPAPGEEMIMWLSIPPVGQKVKALKRRKSGEGPRPRKGY